MFEVRLARHSEPQIPRAKGPPFHGGRDGRFRGCPRRLPTRHSSVHAALLDEQRSRDTGKGHVVLRQKRVGSVCVSLARVGSELPPRGASSPLRFLCSRTRPESPSWASPDRASNLLHRRVRRPTRRIRERPDGMHAGFGARFSSEVKSGWTPTRPNLSRPTISFRKLSGSPPPPPRAASRSPSPPPSDECSIKWKTSVNSIFPLSKAWRFA